MGKQGSIIQAINHKIGNSMVSDILIVDDEADIRELVAGILDDEGYETRVACNSDEALAQISERIPKLIF